MKSTRIELDPRFVPHDRAPRAGGWSRIALPLLVLAGYFALAGAQDGPIQVWLVVFAPLALISAALALHITDGTDPD